MPRDKEGGAPVTNRERRPNVEPPPRNTDRTDRKPSEWFSVPAARWVLDEAPDVPASLVAVLIGLARHSDETGANTYPSEATLAGYTRKTVRQVRRDLADLQARGLIRRPRDQSAAASIRADRRPIVYDLACAPERDRSPTTGHPRPVVGDHTTGHPGQHDRTPMSSEESLKKTEQAAAREPSSVENFDALALARRLSIEPTAASAILAEVQRKRAPRNLQSYLRSIPDAELLGYLTNGAPVTNRPAIDLPPVCGQCDAQAGEGVHARIVWLDDDRIRSKPCPHCNPKAVSHAS